MTDTTSAHADPAATSPAQTGTEPRPTSGRGGRAKRRNAGQDGRRPDGGRGLAATGQVSFDVAQFLVALCIVGLYIASMWLMFEHRADPRWDRMVYLYTGFEAIVFVAAGAIFGTRIQRASVVAAHEQSQQAREDLHAERARADRAAQLEEAAAAFIKALRAFEDEEPPSTGNEQEPGTSADRIGKRGSDASTVPTAGRGGLSFAIKLAEELFPQGRR
jgi:hypothetical protein